MRGLLRHLLVLLVGLALVGGLDLALRNHLQALATAGSNASTWLGPYQVGILHLAGINIILAVSLNLITGYTGQFSIGHMGFAAVGAYVAATFTRYLAPAWMGPNTSLGLALLAGGLTAALGGVLVGLPALRLRGDYLAIATLGFGEIIRVLLLNTGETHMGSLVIDLGGARGFTNLAHLSSFASIYGCALLAIWCQMSLVHSSPGRALQAVREDELAAQAMGVDVTRAKVMAFCLGSFFAGVAGGLFAHEFQILNPKRFGYMNSFEIVVMVVLGGMGNTSGSVLAAVFLTILPEGLRNISASLGSQIGRPDLDLRMVIYSLMLVGMMLVRPQGLLGKRELLPTGWLDPEPSSPPRPGPIPRDSATGPVSEEKPA